MRKFVFILGMLMVSIAMAVVIVRTTGATFPQYQIQKWIRDYQAIQPNVKIEYEGGGSGYGQEAFLKGLTHIARTDPPVKETIWKKFMASGDIPLQFPEIVGAVVVAFNVPGVEELKLDGETLARIFAGDIEYWDDPAIKWLNSSVNLPHKKIVVVHRSDSSGTTKIFTTYLSLVSPEFERRVGTGKLVDWPVDKMGRGLAGKGNPGIVAILEKTPFSIAYTELAFAISENLKVVALKNKNGKFIHPTEESIKEAVAHVKSYIPDPFEGYKENLKQLLNAPGENSYPIVAFTHILVWKNVDMRHYSAKEAEAVKSFLKWVLTEGQRKEHLAVGYVSLPTEISKIGLKAVNQIEVK